METTTSPFQVYTHLKIAQVTKDAETDVTAIKTTMARGVT